MDLANGCISREFSMEANNLHNDPLHTQIMALRLELLYCLD